MLNRRVLALLKNRTFLRLSSTGHRPDLSFLYSPPIDCARGWTKFAFAIYFPREAAFLGFTDGVGSRRIPFVRTQLAFLFPSRPSALVLDGTGDLRRHLLDCNLTNRCFFTFVRSPLFSVPEPT